MDSTLKEITCGGFKVERRKALVFGSISGSCMVCLQAWEKQSP